MKKILYLLLFLIMVKLCYGACVYTYTKKVDVIRLSDEIKENLNKNLIYDSLENPSTGYIDISGDNIEIGFNVCLSTSEEVTLNNIIEIHISTPSSIPKIDRNNWINYLK